MYIICKEMVNQGCAVVGRFSSGVKNSVKPLPPQSYYFSNDGMFSSSYTTLILYYFFNT